MTKRECEVCHYTWNSKSSSDWLILCPICKTSGYHQRTKSPVSKTNSDQKQSNSTGTEKYVD